MSKTPVNAEMRKLENSLYNYFSEQQNGISQRRFQLKLLTLARRKINIFKPFNLKFLCEKNCFVPKNSKKAFFFLNMKDFFLNMKLLSMQMYLVDNLLRKSGLFLS